jgi:hypothetical protein
VTQIFLIKRSKINLAQRITKDLWPFPSHGKMLQYCQGQEPKSTAPVIQIASTLKLVTKGDNMSEKEILSAISAPPNKKQQSTLLK